MIVGSLRVRLLLREARTLKDKRQVVRSIIDRLRNEYNLSVTEVEELDNPRIAELGMAMVGWDGKAVRDKLQSIADALRRHPIAEFLQCELDV
jgi:uncharacterized protein YlxP (DUF503 family)